MGHSFFIIVFDWIKNFSNISFQKASIKMYFNTIQAVLVSYSSTIIFAAPSSGKFLLRNISSADNLLNT